MKKMFGCACILFLFCATAKAQPAPNRIENLGSLINTTYPEVRPTISADGQRLYFVIEGHPQNKNTIKNAEAQDVWYSELGADGKWAQAVPADIPVNAGVTNALFWVSPDGNRILIRGTYEGGKYVGRGISMCHKTSSGWSAPEKLNIKTYEQRSLGKYSGAMLGSDGKTLLLYLAEEKDNELSDVYVSFLEEGNVWSEPKNLGTTINSEETDEMAPFLASDGQTLYFSSNREGGYGENDIWMVRRLDESWTKWSDPVNLGAEINTKGWDAYFALDASGEYAYMASTQNAIGSTDIVKVKLNPAERPTPMLVVYGKVFNALSKEPISAAFEYKTIGQKVNGNGLSSTDGTYKIVLPYGSQYSISASANQYFPVYDSVSFNTGVGNREIHRDIYFTPVPVLSAADSARERMMPVFDSTGSIIAYVLPEKRDELLHPTPSDEPVGVDGSDVKGKAKGAVTATIKKKKGKKGAKENQDIANNDGAYNVVADVPVKPAKKGKRGTTKKPALETSAVPEEQPSTESVVKATAKKPRKQRSNVAPASDPADATNVAIANTIHFETGKYLLTEFSFGELEKLATQLQAETSTNIVISAHTDNVGNSAKNLRLSYERAESVRQYLLYKGIEDSRISIKGYGATKPVASNATEEGRLQNRRVEFLIAE